MNDKLVNKDNIAAILKPICVASAVSIWCICKCVSYIAYYRTAKHVGTTGNVTADISVEE